MCARTFVASFKRIPSSMCFMLNVSHKFVGLMGLRLGLRLVELGLELGAGLVISFGIRKLICGEIAKKCTNDIPN